MSDDTLKPGDTMKPGDTLKPGDTARAGDTVQAGGGTSTTTAVSGIVLAAGQTIVLNGKNCTIESRIKTSGEAVVYTVKMDNKTYIFKHYKPNTPLSDTAKEVLSKIKNNPHDRIIKLIDFGKYNDQDYEIMELAEGGTLSEYLEKSAIRDVKQLKSIVNMINEGLQQMHGKYNVIYQDLKPDNIFFRDAKKTQIVLADFGISSVMETGEKKSQVVASLTDLYGALELSPKTGHKYVIATPSVDYYSLGITMIEMWLGEKPFKNIPAVQRDYQISEERIDLPPDMPTVCKTLVQGLLKYNRNERWGDKQIQQWLKGEALQAAGKSNLAFSTEMFSDTENFSSPKELADLMVKYPDQGAKILYSGIVDKWFDKSGMSLRAEEIKEVTAQYAKDKQAGYYTAIYKLDPVRPWTSKGGKACTNTEEIAQTLLSESAYYMEDLKKPNARLYLYLKAVEGANGAEVSVTFQKYFTEYNSQYALSLICLQLQDNCIILGSKKYASPEELTQEKDTAQINLIKKAVMEDHSLLLVWLSSLYKDKLPTSNGFSEQPITEKFFLLGLLPYFSFKEIDPQGWQKNASRILMGLIDNNPGRADLFEAYAAQGLPLNDEIGGGLYKTPINYVISVFKMLRKKCSEETILNLIRLMVKLGADVNASENTLLFAVKENNVSLVKLLLELGADKAAVNAALKSGSLSISDEIMLLVDPSAKTKAPAEKVSVPLRIIAAILYGIKWFIDDYEIEKTGRVSAYIYSIISTAGIALGSWAILERVFGLSLLWSLGVSAAIMVGILSFVKIAIFKDEFETGNKRGVKFLPLLILAIAGILCFFNISNGKVM